MVLHSMTRDESHTTSTTDFEDKSIERQREKNENNEQASHEETTDSKRKVDFRVLPIFGATYAATYIDRVNISVARIAGLDGDPDLDVGSQDFITLLIFFIGHFRIPSNIPE
ncbi:hypothetical protein BGZ57DRAFT_931653 [Hyaloscypha finlandica]|nr:hypothetical protein BGZ57DRAFT_931653 [Hyaloscypha finlandica]KAH8786314.1 hypothetical protein F5882DRAFT_462067 [Hyaloscypha sp. PMI_1271]